MLAVPFFLAMLVAGVVASRALWQSAFGARAGEAGEPHEPLGPFESAASAALLALAITVVLDWSLAILQVFTRGALLVAAVAIAAVASRGWRRVRLPSFAGPSRAVAIALAPVALWLAYAFVRSALLYPFVSDALAYHLPKALLIVTTRGYAAFDGPDMRLTTFPANYEMLCADVLALDRSDRLVAGIAMASVIFLAVVAAAMAERWWGRGRVHPALCALLVLGVPAVVVATGAPKNDLLLSALVLAAVHFGARWGARGERASLALAMLAGGVAIGTKPTAIFLLLALAPCVAWRARAAGRGLWSLENAREIALWVGGSVVLSIPLGGAAYLYNLVAIGRPIGLAQANGYGDWSHLATFPLLAFLRGFSFKDEVWVPWQGKAWFWPHDDLFYSHFGTLASLALLALPFFRLLALRRPRALDGRGAERALASVAILIVFFAILPAHLPEPPVGQYLGIVRYTTFFPVLLFLWTVVPWARDARPWAAGAAVLGAAAVFTAYAARDVLHDTYVPGDFLVGVLRGDERPRGVKTWSFRAGQWLDERAGPDDVIAFDGAFDAWVYPLYGREMSRTVHYLHDTEGGHSVIPDDARWVAIDQSWNVCFGAEGWVDFSTYLDNSMHGLPLPEDVALYHQLLADSRFRLAYRDEYSNQAVFERVRRTDDSAVAQGHK